MAARRMLMNPDTTLFSLAWEPSERSQLCHRRYMRRQAVRHVVACDYGVMPGEGSVGLGASLLKMSFHATLMLPFPLFVKPGESTVGLRRSCR
jgi:hypothetical protein